MLQQLFLRGGSEVGILTDSHHGAYEADGVELGDVCIEAQTLSEPPELLCNVLGISRLGAVDDQGTARFHVHGRWWWVAKWDGQMQAGLRVLRDKRRVHHGQPNIGGFFGRLTGVGPSSWRGEDLGKRAAASGSEFTAASSQRPRQRWAVACAARRSVARV